MFWTVVKNMKRKVEVQFVLHQVLGAMGQNSRQVENAIEQLGPSSFTANAKLLTSYTSSPMLSQWTSTAH